MSWVLGRGGQILYKAMWTSAARVGDFLERYRAHPTGLRHAPFLHGAGRGPAPGL